jgi:hypothetical protein
MYGGALRRWWLIGLRYVPPFHRPLTALCVILSVCVMLSKMPVSPEESMPSLFLHHLVAAIGSSSAVWLLLTLPWHLLRQSSLTFAKSWPVLAAFFLLMAQLARGNSSMPPLLILGFGTLLLVSTLRHLKRNQLTMALIISALMLAMATAGIRLDIDPSDPLVVWHIGLPMAIGLFFTEEAPSLAPPETRWRQVAAVALALLALSLFAMPIGEQSKLVALLVAVVAGEWLALLPTPGWIHRAATARFLSREGNDPAVLVRLLALVALWMVFAVVLMKAETTFASSLISIAGAATLCTRCLWLLLMWLPDAWSTWRGRTAA